MSASLINDNYNFCYDYSPTGTGSGVGSGVGGKPGLTQTISTFTSIDSISGATYIFLSIKTTFLN